MGGVAVGLERERGNQVDGRQGDSERERQRQFRQSLRLPPRKKQRIGCGQEKARQKRERKVGANERGIGEGRDRKPASAPIREPAKAERHRRYQRDRQELRERAAAVEVEHMVRRGHEGERSDQRTLRPAAKPGVHGEPGEQEARAECADDRGVGRKAAKP